MSLIAKAWYSRSYVCCALLLLLGGSSLPSWAKNASDNFNIVLSTSPGDVDRVAISPDRRTLASVGHWDKTLRLWDYESGRELRTLRGHSEVVEAVTFSGDGRTILSGANDKTVNGKAMGR
jgi:WD40 repeat protein